MDLEAVPPALAAPTTSLLSLPTELLVRIGHGVAPDGGRKVGALRLTCRRLERAVSHIAWASIYLESEPSRYNPLISALIGDLDGRAAQVTSVRWDLPHPELECVDVHTAVLSKLRSLERLHVVGEDGASQRQPLPKAVWKALGAFPRLKDGLILERMARHVTSGASKDVMSEWLPENTGSIELLDCETAFLLFSTTHSGYFFPSTLRHPVRRMVLDGSTESFIPRGTLLFIGMALTSATCAEVRFSKSDILTGFVESVRRWPSVPATPLLLRKLRLLHLPALFDPDSSTTGAGEALMLEALSHTPITSLSLPVTESESFAISSRLGAIVMQNVTTLTLETDPVAAFVAKRDLYAPATHTTLITFLSTSFPNLTELNLTGWFDATGIQGPATATPRILSTQYSLIWSLISALGWTDVVEIRLKSSNGHADGDSGCCFTRADKDAPEWNTRLALYI